MTNPIKIQTVKAKGVKFSVIEGEETARAYLYIMYKDLHCEPFALLKDVYVDKSQKGKGSPTKLVKQVITAAQSCYKLIAICEAACTYRIECIRDRQVKNLALESIKFTEDLAFKNKVENLELIFQSLILKFAIVRTVVKRTAGFNKIIRSESQNFKILHLLTRCGLLTLPISFIIRD